MRKRPTKVNFAGRFFRIDKVLIDFNTFFRYSWFNTKRGGRMKIGFIGVGNMAQAMIKGLVKADQIATTDILVHGAHPANYEAFAAEQHITPVADNIAVVEQADIVFLAVKPYIVPLILEETGAAFKEKQPLMASMAAGLSLAKLSQQVDADNLPILRIMPNVNVANRAGITAVVGNEQVSADQLNSVKDVLSQLGGVVEIGEKDFTTFSALAGSSPAFVYLFIDSMARAGVKHGLTKKAATEIAAQAVLGSAQNVLLSDDSPWDLIDKVSSPGGTTVAGLLAMEEAGLMSAVVKGIDATIEKDLESQK